MDVPPIRHAKVGDAQVAYQVMGEGPDLIYFSGMLSHLDLRWENPALASFQRSLASFSRLILFDRRGTGLSDGLPPGREPTWELFVEDVRAVLDSVGSEQAAVFAVLDAGPAGILFASSHPDRTSALVLSNTSARYVQTHDYREGLTPQGADAILMSVEEMWGTEEFAQLAVPSRRQDKAFVRWYAKFQRSGTKPRDAAAWLRGILELDVRDALPSIHVPTLVLHTTEYALVPVAQGRYLAETIAGARLVELEGGDGVVWIEHRDRVVAEVERLVTGARSARPLDRLLATVLMTDIVGSTLRAAELGDRRWTDLLRAHDATVRDLVASFQGRFIKSTGDGLVAVFDAPSRALRCAAEVRDRTRELGLGMRAGLHTGEVERLGEDVGGIAVHIAARVLDRALEGEILATRTVKDLVAGSEIEFAHRGNHAFKGVPDEWDVYAATI